MNTVWSDEIQSSEILYYSRFGRFNDYNKDEWFSLFGICDGMKVLEVGCGPGHFCNMIKKYFPTCQVYGVDLDDNHIEFAKQTSKQLGLDINYSVGDVTNLQFEDNYFDVIFSHTLVEHLPFDAFVLGQKKVLKSGGKLVFIKIDPNKKHINCFDEFSEQFNQIEQNLEYIENKHTVGTFTKTPPEFLSELKKYNFENMFVEFRDIMFYYPDKCTSKEQAKKQIEDMKNAEKYEYMFKLKNTTNGDKFKQQLFDLLEQKYQKRFELLKNNQKVFDYESTAIMVYTATKI